MAYAGSPIEMCTQRASEGLCACARRGGIKGFSAVDDPYEPPRQPVTTLNNVDRSPEGNAKPIVEFLEKPGFFNSVVIIEINRKRIRPALPQASIS